MRAWAKRNDKKRFTVDQISDPCNPIQDPFANVSVLGPLCDPESLLLKQKPEDAYQYSFVGPLSMQKGCDNAFHMYTKKIDGTNDEIGYETNKLSYRGTYNFLFSWILYKIFVSGENPLVATDARCFMPWIASQYNMKLEKDYEERVNCEKGAGKRSNIDQERC